MPRAWAASVVSSGSVICTSSAAVALPPCSACHTRSGLVGPQHSTPWLGRDHDRRAVLEVERRRRPARPTRRRTARAAPRSRRRARWPGRGSPSAVVGAIQVRSVGASTCLDGLARASRVMPLAVMRVGPLGELLGLGVGESWAIEAASSSMGAPVVDDVVPSWDSSAASGEAARPRLVGVDALARGARGRPRSPSRSSWMVGGWAAVRSAPCSSNIFATTWDCCTA